jgi:mannose-6-phosphate isomerase-like protein (cupin superfamily)
MAEVGVGGRVVKAGEARRIDLGGFDVLVLADKADTENALSLIETREPSAGVGPPLHIHRDCAEAFYVIEGEYRFHLNGQDFVCAAGSYVYVPVGMTHTFGSIAPGSRKLNLYVPAAMVGYFDELADAIKTGVDEKGLEAIAERHHVEVVGPVPEGYL